MYIIHEYVSLSQCAIYSLVRVSDVHMQRHFRFSSYVYARSIGIVIVCIHTLVCIYVYVYACPFCLIYYNYLLRYLFIPSFDIYSATCVCIRRYTVTNACIVNVASDICMCVLIIFPAFYSGPFGARALELGIEN